MDRRKFLKSTGLTVAATALGTAPWRARAQDNTIKVGLMVPLTGVVASGGREIAEVLEPVYRGLELDWDPATAGSISQELDRDVDPGEIEEALIAGLAASYELIDTEIDETTLRLAERDLERTDTRA